MDNLQAGEILLRKSDGSKWRFLHYKPVNVFANTTDDKNFVHVRMWDNETKDWKTGDHEEFPATKFEEA